MNIYIVTEDLGDGDVALRYFSSTEAAEKYMFHRDNCWHESNPHELDVSDMDSFLYNDGE